MTKPKSDYSIQTVSNALRLLEAFREEDEIGVSELARRLDLHKNNVFRLLATLEERGYIEQSPESDRYRLGTRCLELGRAFSHGHSLLDRARPILEALAASQNETVHLGVLRDFEVVHLDGEQPRQLVLTASRIGERLPVHCTALGKVLLGCAVESVREGFDRDWVSTQGLEQRTNATICDRHKFFEHLRSVAVQGFALDLEECEIGLRCAAMPVFDATGQALAALSVSGPGFRLGEERLLGDVVPALGAAAERLSRELGYSV
ncbi:MAG: IclR family transcriptional regulator [Deltaproteobacteria bacterium]|nr:IclR family transcriptional regulator [Deltaproteobacteria bacterium]